MFLRFGWCGCSWPAPSQPMAAQWGRSWAPAVCSPHGDSSSRAVCGDGAQLLGAGDRAPAMGTIPELLPQSCKGDEVGRGHRAAKDPGAGAG